MHSKATRNNVEWTLYCRQNIHLIKIMIIICDRLHVFNLFVSTSSRLSAKSNCKQQHFYKELGSFSFHCSREHVTLPFISFWRIYAIYVGIYFIPLILYNFQNVAKKIFNLLGPPANGFKMNHCDSFKLTLVKLKSVHKILCLWRPKESQEKESLESVFKINLIIKISP